VRIDIMPTTRSERTARGLSRRQLLCIGGAFGLSLPQLLWADSARASDRRRTADKSCIFIVLSGGLSHIDTFDPKPDAPLEIRGPYQTIPTRTPGLRLTEMLPQLAQCSDLYCVVHSMSHDDTVHVSAAHTMLTGQPDGRASNESPMIGSLVSKFRPSANMPSHVWLHNMKTGTNKVPKYLSGLGKIGHAHAPLRVGHELDNPSSPTFRFDSFDPPADVSQGRLAERFELLKRVEPGAATGNGASDAHRVFQDKARDLVTGAAAQRAFDLSCEPARVRDRYGRHPLGQYALMARRLIEAGVRIVTVTAWPGLAPGETAPTVTQVWDMHGDRYTGRDTMYGNGPFGMKWSLPRLDQAVSALLEDLHARGMLEDTFVVLVSEFGRTPQFENDGKGRGHWPQCYSGILAGGGVRGGAVYGSSDRRGAYVATGRPISHADFGATLYHALGIPPETRYGPDGFSLRVSDGEPVRELFG
jgi:hypothetical protein